MPGMAGPIMSRRAVAGTLGVLGAGLACSPLLAQTPLSDPFAPRGGGSAGATPAAASAARTACATAPAPVQGIAGVQFYTDAKRSRADPALRAQALAADAPLAAFARAVEQQSNAWLASGGTDTAAAQCGLALLRGWATQDALLTGSFNTQGERSRRWYATGLAIAYLAMRHALPGGSDPAIAGWFAKLARACAQDPPPVPNNLSDWTAAAVTACAIAGNDRRGFNMGVALASAGIDQIARDGSLPLERARGQMALHYHSFALTPLLVVAELARANGVDLYARNDDGLRRLTAFVAEGLADMGLAAKRLGGPQVLNATSVPWLALARKRFGADAVAAVPPAVAVDKLTFLGGDQRLLFG